MIGGVRTRKSALRLAVPLVALCLGAACTKAPAQAALAAADQAIEAAKPELEKYAPAEFTSVSDAAKAAHARFDQGDYKGALAAAQELPGKVQAAMTAAQAKKDELSKAWGDFQASLPGMVDAFKTKVADLAAMKKLPKGMDKAKVQAAQAELAAITQGWSETTSAFAAGQVSDAVEKAKALKGRVEAAMAALGGGAETPAVKK
jgi:hypothetical protein